MKSVVNAVAVAALLATTACSSGSSSSTRPAPGVTLQPAPAASGGATAKAVSPTAHATITTQPSSKPATTSPKPPTPAASPRTTAPAAVEVDNTSSGHTFHLVVGQHLSVILDGTGWTDPNASAPTVLQRVSTKQRQQSARAGFKALKKGSSTVSATQSGGRTRKTWSIRVVVG